MYANKKTPLMFDLSLSVYYCGHFGPFEYFVDY